MSLVRPLDSVRTLLLATLVVGEGVCFLGTTAYNAGAPWRAEPGDQVAERERPCHSSRSTSSGRNSLQEKSC